MEYTKELGQVRAWLQAEFLDKGVTVRPKDYSIIKELHDVCGQDATLALFDVYTQMMYEEAEVGVCLLNPADTPVRAAQFYAAVKLAAQYIDEAEADHRGPTPSQSLAVIVVIGIVLGMVGTAAYIASLGLFVLTD